MNRLKAKRISWYRFKDLDQAKSKLENLLKNNKLEIDLLI